MSFDDGRHWEPMKGNLPVAPVYDMVIKGVEMVVASHGRSFWILDDLTPLHQLRDELIGAPHHLFQPRPAVRLHVGVRRFADEPRPGLVNYTRTDTSVVSFMPRKEGRHYLDAGESPPVGVRIQYYLRDRPEGALKLEVLSADGGTVLRSYSSEQQPGQPRLPTESGINRFVWNMRLPGAPRVVDEKLDPWQRDDGPMVLSGSYQVRLTVDGQSLTQPFEIVPDPRLSVTPDDLRQQFDMLQVLLDKIGTANRLINRIGALQKQVEAWRSWTADHAQASAIREAAQPLETELAALVDTLIDVHYPEAQLYAVGLQEKLNALFEFVDSASYAPAQQSRQVLDELAPRLDAALARFEREVVPRVNALNDAIRGAGLGPVAGGT